MPSGVLAKRSLLGVGLGLVVLLIVGLVMGAVGNSVLGGKDSEPFINTPEIHLPPQPLFPADLRDECLGLVPGRVCAGEAKEAEHDATPLPVTKEADEHESTPLPATKFAVTNTLISAWFTTIVIILFFTLGIRRRALVPGRFQGLVEALVEGVLNFASGVLGPEMARKALPIVATIFFFVLFNAWMALFPFYQFVGFVDGDSNIKAHLLRSAGTDLNMPLALALISFVFVEYWGFRAHGFGYLKKFFALGNLLRFRLSGLIDAFVGFLELVSEVVRIFSFTFRLFGNMTAGEILVVMITFLVPFVAVQFVFGLELLGKPVEGEGGSQES